MTASFAAATVELFPIDLLGNIWTLKKTQKLKKNKKSKWYFLSQIMSAKHKASNVWAQVTFLYTKCLQSTWCIPCVIISHHCILICSKTRTAVHFIANSYCCLHTDISIFNILIYVCTHTYTYTEMHVFVQLQIDTDNWLGEQVNTGADTPGERLAKLQWS